MANNILLSVVSPVYNAEQIIDELVKRIKSELVFLGQDNFEIILVEDNGPDQSWRKIQENCASDNRIKGIRLSRNFGQHYAITAGIEAASGEYIVVMDCDLQDNPLYIRQMIEEARRGNEIVYTVRKQRRHSIMKNLLTAIYYKFYRFLTGSSIIRNNIGSFSLITKKVRDEFVRIHDYHRHYILVLSILGFRSTIIEIEHDRRFQGKSSYTFLKLVSHAITAITSQSVRLLRLSIAAGMIIFILALIYGAYIIYEYFTDGLLPGYASLMVTLLLSTGLILTSIGIAGIYIGKIFEQVKERPLYIVSERINI